MLAKLYPIFYITEYSVCVSCDIALALTHTTSFPGYRAHSIPTHPAPRNPRSLEVSKQIYIPD